MKGQKIFLLAAWLAFFTMANAQQYSRVVSLAPSLTKNIYYLNAQSGLVACTSYCHKAKEDDKTVVASMVTVNVERIVGLKPDLVLATSITNPEYIEMLRKFNIRVEVFPTPNSFAEVCSQFVEMGKLLGKEQDAVQQVANIKKEIEELKLLAATSSVNKKVFIQIGADPLYAVIPSSFMNDYILFANATNVAENLARGALSREAVIARNPDYIFVVTMGIVGEEEKKVWESFDKLNAVKNNKIFIIDSDLACTPTPPTFLQTMRLISEYLND